eukprot:Skav215942  [mRNA]  locus=scaffold226:632515:635565:+ [translate_table: standard]
MFLGPRLSHAFIGMAAASGAPLQLRGYQKQCVERAKEGNVVVCLKTGAGKTLVAVKVIDHFLQQNPGRKVLFLVPTRALVKQQADYCRNQCQGPPDVAEVCGMECEKWDQLKWDDILRKNKIIVGTSEVLRRAMDHGFVILGRLLALGLCWCLFQLPDQGHHLAVRQEGTRPVRAGASRLIPLRGSEARSGLQEWCNQMAV